ncbi:MAG: nicotinamidase [candidate division Zixibacteria bacterium SM23_81]|nr:MAG: nicotinamidase [candidate division Zixibacteria bacterium SM23_81]
MAERWALLIINMLNDFVQEGAPLEVPVAWTIVDHIRIRLQEARSLRIPVIYICDAHAPNDREFTTWSGHAVRGTHGAQVIPELAPRVGEPVVHKTRYSGFFQTHLEMKLRQREVSGLVLTGVVTNVCILYTTADAVSRGYQVRVPENCVAAHSPEDQAWALKQLRDVLRAEIV